MSPQDPRHGTTAGHNGGCHCAPCAAAKLVYDKRRRLVVHRSGSGLRVPAWRAQRRVEALQALGWTLRQIAQDSGIRRNHVIDHRCDTVYASTFARVDATYRRLSMRLPDPQTAGEKSGYARTRNHAKRNGYAPPMAWDDIDDPSARPVGMVREVPGPVDPVVVERVLSGDYAVPTTAAERRAVIAAWIDKGRALNELERYVAWNVYREKRGAA